MAISLNKPAIGAEYGQAVNDNFTTIEDALNGDSEIGPLKARVRVNTNGALRIKDGMSEPSTVSGRAILFVDTSHNLKIKFSDGTVETINLV